MNLDLDEKIIRAVKPRQALYNKNTKDYHDPVLVEKAWKAVAAQCGRIGEEDSIKSRWNYIKLQFRRKRKVIETTKNDASVKEQIENSWPLYSMLDFMNRHITRRSSRSSRKFPSTSLDETKVVKKEMSIAHDEQIIKAVEEREAIYNEKLKEHDDPGFIENVWREIAAECGVNVEFVKNRWNILKLTFIRKRRELLLASSRADTNLPVGSDWPLYSMMTFMDERLQLRNSKNVTHYASEDETSEDVADASYDLVVENMPTDPLTEVEENFAGNNVSQTSFQLDQSNYACTSTLASPYISTDNYMREAPKVVAKDWFENLLRENLKKSEQILSNVEILKSHSIVDKYMTAFTADIKSMPEAKQHEAMKKIANLIFDLRFDQS